VSIGLLSWSLWGAIKVRGTALLTRTSPEPYANAATPFVTAALLDSQAISGPAVTFGV
jgi:hypothetical protein